MPGHSIAAATLEYAPPEQISREGTDPRSDISSFGATLYHLLTNRCPISAGIREGVVKQGARDPLPLAREINSLIPPAISGVIHKAMAIARNQRYTTAAAMRIALREATESDSPTVIEPPPPKPGGRRYTQPRPPTPKPAPEPLANLEKAPAPVHLRKPLLVGVAAGLVVGALLVYWLLSGQSPAPVESSAPVDVLSYSLEYKPGERNKFRFHFKSRRNGFLYIVAPNAEKQWITFLTARLRPETGVSDNEIKAGRDYQFFGGGQWIVMRANPASFTLIFTTKKLAQPGFLSADAGLQLSEDDIRALDELRRQSQTRKPRLDADGTGEAIRALEASDAPLVTDIRVAWNARGN